MCLPPLLFLFVSSLLLPSASGCCGGCCCGGCGGCCSYGRYQPYQPPPVDYDGGNGNANDRIYRGSSNVYYANSGNNGYSGNSRYGNSNSGYYSSGGSRDRDRNRGSRERDNGNSNSNNGNNKAPQLSEAQLQQILDALRRQDQKTTTTRRPITTTTTLSPLAQLSGDELQSVLQALLIQQQKPPTTTTTTPSPLAALSPEQINALLASMGVRGASQGVPKEFADLIQEDAKAASAENTIQYARALPSRLMAMLGDDAEDASASISPPPESSTAPPLPIPSVNLPIKPKDKDDDVIRENVFAWENGALAEMGIRKAQFRIEDFGKFEKLIPVINEDEEEMTDKELNEVTMEFYYKFDTYDARWGEDWADGEDGPGTLIRWKGDGEEQSGEGDSSEEEEEEEGTGVEKGKRGGGEEPQQQGMLHRLWRGFTGFFG